MYFVPFTRSDSIGKLTVPNQRTYQNNFSTYFKVGKRLVINPLGILSTSSKVINNLIQAAVQNIFTKETTTEGSVSIERRQVMQEMYVKVEKEKQYTCKNCPDFFGNLSGLQKHFKIKHHKKLSIKCMLCKRIFNTLSRYQNRSIH